MGSNPSFFKGDSLPVESVSYYDVMEFIDKLNAITGQSYRLPTEAEWEYAARGGIKSKGTKFAGSNNASAVGWQSDNSGSKSRPVGTRQPNELGIYDMSGNVLEWVGDWWGPGNTLTEKDSAGPAGGIFRVHRGGSWSNGLPHSRVSARGNYAPGNRILYLGFRLAH
jgi:formylglycine-generating enzyme required for sulfatase activity